MMGRRRKCCCKDCSNVPRLSVSLLSVSTLEDKRYESWSPRCSDDAWHQGGLVVQVVGTTCGQLQRKFRVGDPVETIPLGSRKGKLYTLRGEHVYPRSEWLLDSGTKDEGETVVAPTIQFPKENSSLLSTNKRLSQYVRAEQGKEEEASSKFRVVF